MHLLFVYVQLIQMYMINLIEIVINDNILNKNTVIDEFNSLSNI